MLAVDLGLRAGLAVYDATGRLLRYRSTHFANVGALKRALPRVLDEAPGVSWVVCEGDQHLASIWRRHADKRGARVIWASAEVWRPALLEAWERRDGVGAKEAADRLARRVIEVCGGKRPTSLRHDAAEAILIGLWGLLQVGWLTALPSGVGPSAAAAPGKRRRG